MRAVITALLFVLAPLAQQRDPVIEAARTEAARYSRSIPNYLVSRTTTRFTSKSGSNWRQTDSVSAEVASQANREVYSNIRIDGKPSKALPREGIWSNGEFSTLLDEILNPKYRAVFKNRELDINQSRAAWRYLFDIDKKHSGWDMVG